MQYSTIHDKRTNNIIVDFPLIVTSNVGISQQDLHNYDCPVNTPI